MPDEEKWQERVEHQRLSDKLEDLSDRVRELEITLHGKRAKTGLLAEYERHDALLGRMYAVIWQDSTGQKGILHDIDVLMGRQDNKEKLSERRWDFWKTILAAIISSGALTYLLSQWPMIKKFLPKEKPDPVAQMIERAKHPKAKRKIYRVRLVAPSTNTMPSEPE